MILSKPFVAATCFGFLFTGCKNKPDNLQFFASEEKNANQTKTEIIAANLKTANFKVEGMTCAIGCAKTIQEELNGLVGVQKATINFDTKTANVSFDKTLINSQKLTKVVEAVADGSTYKVLDMDVK